MHPHTVKVKIGSFDPRVVGIAIEDSCPCQCECRCESPVDPRVDELGRKLQARVILADRLRRLIVPSRDEWIGVNLLERDDQLPPRRRA